MKRSKNLLRKGAALAAMSTVLVSQAPLINEFLLLFIFSST